MPFDPSVITEGPLFEDDGAASLLVSWSATSPDGTYFQLYGDRRLIWWGTARAVSLPRPPGEVKYQVGAVGPGEESTDFSASLPPLPGSGDRARLGWDGGAWEEASPPGSGVAGFRVYGEATPGAGINYGSPLAEVPLGVPGIDDEMGYGEGPYGGGGYGQGTGRYYWTSGPLRSGTWHFAVTCLDVAGNESTVMTAAVTISAPPPPPARDGATGLRMTGTYNAGTGKATLSWNPSA